ncbi:MAG: ribonuclease III [Bacteroidales bacterium]
MLNTLIYFIKTTAGRRNLLHNKIYSLTGYRPGSLDLYRSAFTHKSISSSEGGRGSHNNERLEYLGDAILSAVIADYLFTAYPNCKEGFLTQLRSKLVNRENLNRVAMSMGFDKLVRSHKNIVPTKKHIYGNALEALIGAMYLDQGYKKAKKFIIDRIISVHFDLDQLACQDNDFKSQIIQWGQKNKKEISFGSYELTGSDKPYPVFVATIHIMDMLAGEGHGPTKKQAQQHAARQALQNLPS